jgi:hypothetical protein
VYGSVPRVVASETQTEARSLPRAVLIQRKSEHVRSVQYRARKQAAIQLASNLFTRGV